MDDKDVKITFRSYDDWEIREKCKMTMENFRSCVRCGGFISDDGDGVYATENEVSDVVLSIKDVYHGRVPEWATHVCWYNK